MKRHLSQFAEIDENKDGYVDIEEFCQYLSLPVSSQLRDVFSLYDRVRLSVHVIVLTLSVYLSACTSVISYTLCVCFSYSFLLCLFA